MLRVHGETSVVFSLVFGMAQLCRSRTEFHELIRTGHLKSHLKLVKNAV